MTPLSESEARALLIIVKHGYVSCANLGNDLWHKGGRDNCSCPFARPAGAVIKKLRARGFVERHHSAHDPRTLYTATRLGEKHLKTDHATRVAAGLEKA